jgi:hypothetical protein
MGRRGCVRSSFVFGSVHNCLRGQDGSVAHVFFSQVGRLSAAPGTSSSTSDQQQQQQQQMVMAA